MISLYYDYSSLDTSDRDDTKRTSNTELKDKCSRDVCSNCGGACALYLQTKAGLGSSYFRFECSRDVCSNCEGACPQYLVTCVWNLEI